MRPLPKLTDRLPLGGSGLEVSPFCLGMVIDPATVIAAYDAGINFFFLTADMHWPLYEGTRRGLAELLAARPAARDAIVVAVTSYVTQPEFCWAPFQEVLATVPALRWIDLTIAGGAYAHEIAQRSKLYELQRQQRYLGARAAGVTFHDRQAARAMLDGGALDIAFVRYNPLHPGARDDLFPYVAPRGAGRSTLLYNFKSTMGHAGDVEWAQLGVGADYWRPHITDYYRFALAQPALDGILCSLPAPFAVGELVCALDKGALDDDDQQYLLDLGELGRGAATLAPTGT